MKILCLTFYLLGWLQGSLFSQTNTRSVPGRMTPPSLPVAKSAPVPPAEEVNPEATETIVAETNPSPSTTSPGSATSASSEKSEEEAMISPDTIQFPNNPVSDFLLVYEKLKGVTLIKDGSLLAGGANLSLTLNQPVSKAEAIRLLESTLLLNGYAFIAVDNPELIQKKNLQSEIKTASNELKQMDVLRQEKNKIKERLKKMESSRFEGNETSLGRSSSPLEVEIEKYKEKLREAETSLQYAPDREKRLRADLNRLENKLA
ncbi:MAG: hypothetical protein EBU36_09035, partial [Verrucomicrobia bacterium]|nr:hypothetical protein [Verrucomicrobiota bacterium]